MSLPTSLHAYAAEVDTFDKAMASARGIRLPFGALTGARRFVMRLHQCRKLARLDNLKILGPDAPLAGRSEWDILVCSVRVDATDPDKFWVHIEKAREEMIGIEEL